MQELVQENNNHQSKNKLNCYQKNIQNMNNSLILPLLSTLNEKDLKPYWNVQCQELQSKLWLPHKIDLQEVGLGLSNGLSNYMEEKLSQWIKRVKPKNSTQQSLSVLLPASAIPTMEKGQLGGRRKKKIPNNHILGVKKIRIYPKNEDKYKQALSLYRRAYNLAIAYYKNNSLINDIRADISKQIREERNIWNGVYDINIVQDAIDSAKGTIKKTINQGGKPKFKNRKGSIHSFSHPRLGKKLNPAIQSLGEIHRTETIPNEAIGQRVTVVFENNRWYLIAQQYIQTKTETQGKVNCVAIDPGVRTFATTYSDSEVIIVGDKFANRTLLPLMKKVDKLISQKRKLENSKETDKQWYKDRIKYLDKKIAKLRAKKRDLTQNLHNELAYYLVSNYDVIFLPTFETKKMTKKEGRNIRIRTAKEMLNLNHYKFKLKLKWYCQKYGKHLVIVNESYTSKTYSWNGFIDEKLKSKKVIKFHNMLIDRDINGARGILLKQLSKVA